MKSITYLPTNLIVVVQLVNQTNKHSSLALRRPPVQMSWRDVDKCIPNIRMILEFSMNSIDYVHSCTPSPTPPSSWVMMHRHLLSKYLFKLHLTFTFFVVKPKFNGSTINNHGQLVNRTNCTGINWKATFNRHLNCDAALLVAANKGNWVICGVL